MRLSSSSNSTSQRLGHKWVPDHQQHYWQGTSQACQPVFGMRHDNAENKDSISGSIPRCTQFTRWNSRTPPHTHTLCKQHQATVSRRKITRHCYNALIGPKGQYQIRIMLGPMALSSSSNSQLGEIVNAPHTSINSIRQWRVLWEQLEDRNIIMVKQTKHRNHVVDVFDTIPL